MMKLYYAAQTRGFRPRWLLEEAKTPYELVPLSLRDREHKSPEYLRVHPLGSIPALVDGEQAIFDSTAICLHIADNAPESGLAPAMGSPERAAYYQWILFAMTSIEPIVGPVYLRGFRQMATRQETANDEDREKLAPVLVPLQAQLAKHGFVLGEEFTAADVVVGSVLDWGDRVGLLKDAPDLQNYLGKLREREAFVRALA
ncbi:MAG: glutathione S-transferase family protein [Bradymonadaceae bacterium]